MVHKCSEYRLQFRHLTNSTRAEIWRENMSFREMQKRNNMSDHYWRYQLIDEQCECDEGVSEFTTEDKIHALASPFLQPSSNQHEPSMFANQAVQAPDRTVSNENDSASRIDDVETSHSELVPPPKETPNETEEQVGIHSPALGRMSRTKPVSPLTCAQKEDKSLPHVSQSKAFYSKQEHLMPDKVISHLNPSPTRDTLNNFKKEKKPVFVAFGWNDNDKDVGDRKTHNVRAPVDQVNQSALQALEKKQKEVEKYLASQRAWKRHQQSLLSLMPVDYNVWMTEYQEKFCKGHKDIVYNHHRLHTRRPVVWRHS